MPNGDCILVFGISGVGKTSSCEEFVKRHPDFSYVRASTLLSIALAATPEQLRTASAKQIEANQAPLGAQLQRLRAHDRAKSVLVDVHGVIDNDRDLVRIPTAAIASLEPDGLILLEAPPEVVRMRRQRDVRRRPARSLEELSRELATERAAVDEFAGTLGLPLETAEALDDFQLDPVISRLLSRMHAPGR